MLRRIIIITSIIANAAVGHLCMMPMAMAAAAPMPQEMNETNEVMTPMAPMSHADCPDCPHHQEKQQPAQQSSCAGHCLSHASSTNPTNAISITNSLAVVLPTAVPLVVSELPPVVPAPHTTESPPPLQTDTVVLTL